MNEVSEETLPKVDQKELPTTTPKKEKQWGPFEAIKGLDVSRAFLHQAAEIPRHGSTNSLQKTRYPSLKMKMTSIGLACRVTDKKDKDDHFFFLIPEANVIVVYVE